MPRDGNGNYTPPAGNPVVSNSLITSSWANDTVTDIGNELTDSLSRSGKGGLTAPLGIVDKSGSVPGLNFVLEPTTGLKREGAGDMRLQVLANDVIRFLDTNRATDVWNNDLTTPGWERVFTTPVANVLDANVEKTLQIKRETTGGVVPAALAAGELAVNIGDSPPRLFVGDGVGVQPVIPFPVGTKMLFYQNFAPVDWVIDQAVDEHSVRLTKGSSAGGQEGGISGGTYDFSTLFADLAEGATPGVGNHTLTGAESGVAAHDHTMAHNHPILADWQAGGDNKTRLDASFQANSGPTPNYTLLTFGPGTDFPFIGDPTNADTGTATETTASSAHSHTIDLRAKWAACIICQFNP